MASYQPFLIADFQTGKDISKTLWLVPQDAFPILSNARVHKGVLEKRYGSTLLAATGTGLPIMGIFEARYQGVPRILVPDTKRMYSYALTAAVLTDLSTVDTYTGTDADYFQFCTFNGKTYFVNGVQADGVRSWNDATDSLAVETTAGAVTIQTCRHLYVLKDRLHFVSPTIGGVFYPDYTYYSDVDSVTITGASQYYKYARDDVPVNCTALDMETILIMGRKSSWRVVYTGDTLTPFTCKTVDAVTGSLTPHVAVEYRSPTVGRLIATLSNTQMLAFDGFQFRKIDAPIRDLTQEMALRYLHYCQGTRLTEREALYLTYPETGQTYPNVVLEYNVLENNWATHNLALHCVQGISGEVPSSDYGYGAGILGRASSGYTLAGDRNGNLLRLDYGASDNSSNIAMEIRSAALNPFQKDRRKAYLGWIDLYADNDANATFSLYLYKDDGTTAYKTIAVSCSGAGDRFWQRINVGGDVGNFHRLRIANDAQNNRPRIHAICPWFKPGGLIATTSGSGAVDWPDQTWRLHYESGAAYVQRKELGVWVNYTTWGA